MSSSAASSYYVSERYFLLTLAVALALHGAALLAWYLAPPMRVVDVPVRVLNIRLGGGDAMTSEEANPKAPDGNSVAVENTISHLVREQKPEEETHAPTVDNGKKALSALDKAMGPAPKSLAEHGHGRAVVKGKFDMRQEGDNVAAPVQPVTAQQFVRENTTQAAPVANGSDLGNSSSKNADIVSRYEQLISLWIQKFKVYPDAARSKGLQGEAMVRIRIDRQGNIRYYILEQTTGHPELDRAAIDMIRRANPVPAVPPDYPPGDLIEFLIPVSFHLQ